MSDDFKDEFTNLTTEECTFSLEEPSRAPPGTPSPGPPNRCVTILQALEGKLLILIAGLLTVPIVSLTKNTTSLPVGQFMSCMTTFTSLSLLTLLLHTEGTVQFRGKARYVLGRAGCGALAGLARFWAAKNMDYGDSVALFAFFVPLFAALFSRFFWGEKLSFFTIGAFVMGLIGVVCITKPSFIFTNISEVPYNRYYVFVPFSGSVLLGFAYSCMRKVGTEVSPVLVSLATSVFLVVNGVVFNRLSGASFTLPDCYTDRFVVVLGGVGLSVALIALNRGLGLERSGPGTLIRNFEIVTAYLIQLFLHGNPVSMLSVGGALCVLLSLVIVTLDKLYFQKFCKYEI